ncbi:hypothetical protein HLB42_20120 (plasmid) [Deinococcus sp. D7000]|nr:hypothetical protein HLB42_20120 [Deinococcus sp. D7000]
MKKTVLFGFILLASCGQQTQPVYEPVELALSAVKSNQAGVVSISILADTGFYNPSGVTIKIMDGAAELKTIDPSSAVRVDAVPNHNWTYRFDSTLTLDASKTYALKAKMSWEKDGKQKSVESQPVNLAAGAF